MDGIDLVPLLRGVPPFRLRLIELAWKVVGEDGSLNVEQLTFHAKEIVEAIEEAEAYSRDTREMVQWLTLMVRSQP
jgi:hypothetical protein